MAFACLSRADVDAFYQAAITQGGTDDGPPGIRENYGPGYYAAFVLDPDGYRLEAVFHEEVTQPFQTPDLNGYKLFLGVNAQAMCVV